MAGTHIRPVVAYPAVKQLARSDWRAALAIYREILEAGPTAVHVDDEAEATTGDDVATHKVVDVEQTFESLEETPMSASANEDAHTERRMNDTPSEREMMRNIGWTEFPVTKKGRSEPIGWVMRDDTGKVCLADGTGMEPVRDDYHAKLGGLTYNVKPGLRKGADGGQLISFLDGKGKVQKPITGSAERGKSRKRTKSGIKRYLATKPTPPSPLHAEPYQRPCHDALPPMYDPLEGKEEARAELEVMMASFTGTIQKCPTEIAKSAHFFGGVVSGSETKSTPAPIWEAPAKRGLNHILEEVAAGGDFADVGRAAGYEGPYTSNASHRGKAELLREAARLIERAALEGKPLPTTPTAEQRAALDEWRGKEAKGAVRAKVYRAANDNNPPLRKAA